MWIRRRTSNAHFCSVKVLAGFLSPVCCRTLKSNDHTIEPANYFPKFEIWQVSVWQLFFLSSATTQIYSPEQSRVALMMIGVQRQCQAGNVPHIAFVLLWNCPFRLSPLRYYQRESRPVTEKHGSNLDLLLPILSRRSSNCYSCSEHSYHGSEFRAGNVQITWRSTSKRHQVEPGTAGVRHRYQSHCP